MQVRDLERLVFERFPRQLAESWDRPGLSVGDPTEEVACIACALDPTPTNVRAAASLGANVLLTHHPAFLDPPFPMTPGGAHELAGWGGGLRGRAPGRLAHSDAHEPRPLRGGPRPSRVADRAYQGRAARRA